MAGKQNKRSGGSMWLGMLVGVVLGLAAAVAVALFVTQAPVPFVDRASRAPGQAPLANVREAPDPNLGLSGITGGAASSNPQPSQAPQTPQASAPADTTRNAMTQDIDQLIASLGQGAPTQRPNVGSNNRPNSASANQPANTQTLYYLQAGAFSSQNDAEALKARILMLGLNGFVQPVQRNGVTLHRVRVGPFHGMDEMNRSRITLGQSNISSAVVRP